MLLRTETQNLRYFVYWYRGGPHARKTEKFDDSLLQDDFMVDYIKVCQNENFEQYVKSDDDFATHLIWTKK